MSVQINNGYILPDMSLSELNNFIRDYRNKIRTISKKLVIERTGNMAMGYMDFVQLPEDKRGYFTEMNRQLFLEKNALSQSSFFAAFSKLLDIEEKIKTENVNRPEYDFLCDLILFPSNGCILAMLFAKQKEYIQAFEEMPRVLPYAYWNNSDKQEGISDEDWSERGAVWENAVGHTGVPALDGLSATCYNQLPFIKPEEVHAYIQERFDIDIRANNYASKIVILRKYQSLVGQTDKLWGTEDMYKESTLYLKTPEGTKEYQEELSYLKKIFKPEITVEDLNSPLSSLVNEGE